MALNDPSPAAPVNGGMVRKPGASFDQKMYYQVGSEMALAAITRNLSIASKLAI
jgi:hypothetical protein